MVPLSELWKSYQNDKQTVFELSSLYGKSPSTIKRRLSEITKDWKQSPLVGGGFVLLDTTYWGRGFGVLLALDSSTGFPMYLSYVRSETTTAVTSLCTIPE
ncbi:MAG: hypothetical protein J6X70_06300 [Muribaculaceae bacterium]|nr:hypothetical protein [Muribaculaceae bacterium]